MEYAIELLERQRAESERWCEILKHTTVETWKPDYKKHLKRYEDCDAAIKVLRASQNPSTSDDALRN